MLTIGVLLTKMKRPGHQTNVKGRFTAGFNVLCGGVNIV